MSIIGNKKVRIIEIKVDVKKQSKLDDNTAYGVQRDMRFAQIFRFVAYKRA